ncbi:hypothetical protein BN874_840019 [Candidatus Contendobacter odensis Run_B_J11]|uniref:HTH cro/C1-type domain-containing protein n=2 Tax=Candidatus Contendibacter odensensis TaxID=1400860 RepID=A0A7U7J6B5_9GAMM|nr:hypothetical protein BN874_840019 [Candidatus Contendobacter odensis Run_B_J11]
MWARRAALICQERGISRQDLARLLGKSVATIGHYLCGRAQPSHEQLHYLAGYLNVSLDSLLRDEGDGLSVEDAREFQWRVPLLAWADVGLRDPTPAAEQVTSPVRTTEHAFAVKVVGSGAAPGFASGDLLIVDYVAGFTSGDYVLCRQDEAVLPAIWIYIKNPSGEFLYPVDAAGGVAPRALGRPLFLRKITAKFTVL